MNREVVVDLGERSYTIHIGRGVTVGDVLGDAPGCAALIVSDSNVDPLYGGRCEKQLMQRGMATARAVVSAGEESKALSVMRDLYDEAFAAGLDRKSVIVALGGGVVGDLAGFVAATFLRGVRYIQAPTSLLAMVDSSVGGKTGVNVPQGKNLIGAFYQPIEVAVDLATLDSLPDREYRSGLAEVVKYGVIWDADFFDWLDKNRGAVLARDTGALATLVARCCEIKAEVVARDEKEGGLRAILNFGHTLGHAIEQVSGYGVLLHGEAVALGMAFAVGLSVREQGLPVSAADKVRNLLRACGLPVSHAKLRTDGVWNELRKGMSADKKAVASVPRFVLADELGRVSFGCEVGEDALAAAFREWVRAGRDSADQGGH